MRVTVRLCASVKPGRFLEAGNPTGLTGLFTHAAPRSTLLYLYSATLDKLKTLPEHSVYRQSAEAITQHRCKIIDAVKPEGYEEWSQRASKLISENHEIFFASKGSPYMASEHGGSIFVTTKAVEEEDERVKEWDGEKMATATMEGSRDSEERANQKFLAQDDPADDSNTITWEPEPRLEATQISDLENQIGAGLIEEVIQVAEGELKLVDIMMESKVWEDLEEKSPQGQWDYFSRDQHTPTTQEPPNK